MFMSKRIIYYLVGIYYLLIGFLIATYCNNFVVENFILLGNHLTFVPEFQPIVNPVLIAALLILCPPSVNTYTE